MQKLCSETVLHDVPGENPFRSLMTLIQTSPLILKVILATAARHGTNRDMHPSSFSKKCHSLDPASNVGIPTISSPSFYHALSYKQSALIQLRKDLQEPLGLNHDLIIASIALFVWMDLLESGRDTWRIHLDGVKKLVQLRNEYNASKYTGMTLGSGEIYPPQLPVHSYFFDTCLM